VKREVVSNPCSYFKNVFGNAATSGIAKHPLRGDSLHSQSAFSPHRHCRVYSSSVAVFRFSSIQTKNKSSIDLIKKLVYNNCMDMFVALADPTRRQILELLASSGELAATAIYERFPVSPQAVSQHLKVLREAHLVEMEKRAQKRVYRLNLQTLSQFEAWVQQTKQRWEERFAALDTVLEREKQKLVKGEQESE
jgi:DNA-binding transcriptional ArsR family regulator